MNKEQSFAMAIYKLGEFSTRQMQKLRQHFGSFEKAFVASDSAWSKSQITDKLANKNKAEEINFAPQLYFEKIKKQNISIIDFDHKNYPRLLKQISDPPFFLFACGNLELLNSNCLAVVGTRRMSNYGKEILQNFIPQIVRKNLTVVSGLAYGVDACAHDLTLQNDGKTIAVLGTPIDNIYPSENKNLAKKIFQKNGLIISEFPPQSSIQKYNFAKRNRLISGLSLGALIIEAPEKSGALITASTALDQNREVFAVPGSIFNLFSEGTNNLIKKGAQLISSAEEIFENLQNLSNSPEMTKSLTLPTHHSHSYLPTDQIEATILSNLTKKTHINELARICQLTMSEITAKLILLEIKNVIRNLGNNYYEQL